MEVEGRWREEDVGGFLRKLQMKIMRKINLCNIKMKKKGRWEIGGRLVGDWWEIGGRLVGDWW